MLAVSAGATAAVRVLLLAGVDCNAPDAVRAHKYILYLYLYLYLRCYHKA